MSLKNWLTGLGLFLASTTAMAAPSAAEEEAEPSSIAKIRAALLSAAKRTPFGPKVSGPIDSNCGPTSAGTGWVVNSTVRSSPPRRR